MDISVTWFYRYIEIYWEISMDLLTQNINEVKIIKSHENVGKLIKNDIKSNNEQIKILVCQCGRWSSQSSKMDCCVAPALIESKLSQHPLTIRASLPFVNYHAPYIYIYIKGFHIHKILKQSFKQRINYNYFISKWIFFRLIK